MAYILEYVLLFFDDIMYESGVTYKSVAYKKRHVAKFLEGRIIAREASYYERRMTNSGINFANFNDQEIILKTFRKVMKLCNCRVYVIYWRFSAK